MVEVRRPPELLVRQAGRRRQDPVVRPRVEPDEGEQDVCIHDRFRGTIRADPAAASSDRSVLADSASVRARRSRYSSTETSAVNGAVRICAIALKIHLDDPLAAADRPDDPRDDADDDPGDEDDAQRVPEVPLHQVPGTAQAAFPRRFSTIRTGTDTHRSTPKMRPGMMRRISPPRTASPTNSETRMTLPSRLKPNR